MKEYKIKVCKIKMSVGFYDISIIVGYLIPNPLYTDKGAD